MINHLQSLTCAEKKLNQVCLISEQKVVTCSRETVIKVWDLEGGEDCVQKLTGHEMPVSSVDYRNGRVASGGRDCTTRVWDIEKGKSVCKGKIDRNLVTANRWITDDTFIQLSEDLHMRLFDARTKNLKPVKAVKMGDNFATTLDVFEDRLLVTGHRGFNDSGADVKLWDLDNWDEPLHVYE